METWRIFALSFFPQLGTALLNEDYSPMRLFHDIYYVHKLHRHPDALLIEKLYKFAAWCLHHDNDALVNAVSVGFYEHIFDDKEDWDIAIMRITTTPDSIPICWPMWEHRLSPEERVELHAALF